MNTLKINSFLICAYRLAYIPTYDTISLAYVIRVTFAIMLIGISFWATWSCYSVLGDYGWFYGDFFLSPVKLRPKSKRMATVNANGKEEAFPTYTGIYRYLNNPDAYIGNQFQEIPYSYSIRSSMGLWSCNVMLEPRAFWSGSYFICDPYSIFEYCRETSHTSCLQASGKHNVQLL